MPAADRVDDLNPRTLTEFRNPTPKYLRWALVEAAVHASSHPVYRERYQRTKGRSANSAAHASPKST
jgi:hypothetical protein